MKKTLLLILLSLISFSAIYAETYTLSPDGTLNIYGTTMNDYTNFLGSMAPWHDKREQIKKVVIQDGMTNIGEFAFCDCPNLSDIIIPTSVKTIRRGAFSYCKSLTSFTIPNTITRIEDDLFAFSSRLTSVTIPNSVTSIGDNAFSYCESLTSITIPNSVTSIEDNAFTFCKSLTSIVIPKSVTSIEAPVFCGCLNLTSIKVENGNTHYDSRNNCNAIIETGSNTLIAGCTKTLIPSSVTSIGEDVFSFLSNLTSITIPNSVTSIGDMAFWGCVKLKSITIPNSVKSIGDYAFEDCSSLTSITIPNSVTSIAVAAFRKCTSLTSITIPNSVTKIGKDAFKECTGLTSIFCEAVTPPECGSDCFYGVPKNIPIYVPSNSISAYKEAYQWKNFPNIQAKIEPTGISFLNTRLTLRVGVKKKLKAIITPEAATIKTITWTSSNTEVATVSADGTVTAKGTGTSVITAKTYNGKTAQFTLTVIQAVTEISLSETNASLWVGKTKTLTATVAPTTASNPSVEWSSSDNKVATVSSKGVITAKGKGTCTITCTAADGYGAKSTCEVTVKQQVTEIALSETTASLWVGDTKTIKATASPTTASNTNVTWSSSDKNVATVSSKGVITAKGEGTCTITCTAADGFGAKSICEVTVKQQPTSIEELQIANDKSPIYNLNGQRINNSNAHKGIYIKNGKKYAK